MKDAEATLLRIPGVTEVQVFTKLLVRCEFPMTDETIVGLQQAQDWIEHETGWKVEMTVSAGKRPEPMPRTDNERDSSCVSVSGETMDAFEALLASEKMLNAEFAGLERASDEALADFEDNLDREADSGKVLFVTGRVVGRKLLVDNPSILKAVRQVVPNPQEEGE